MWKICKCISVQSSLISCSNSQGFIAYHVSDIRTTWEKMYNTMNDLKAQYSCIDDYAVLSATLEQLFIQFARGTELTKAPTVDSTTQTTNV